MKNIIIFGGGTGLSQFIKGIKLFPVETTSVVTVADNGKSTGKLRECFSIPAVGDISKVMLAMSDVSPDIIELLNYRFKDVEGLENHSIKNLLLTAMLDIKGNFKKALPPLEKLLNTKGRILPLTEENVELIGITEDNKEIIGESQITKSIDKIIDIKYNRDFEVNKQVIHAIKKADLIVISSGSLLTSIFPHLCVKKVRDAINKSKVKKLYISNLMSQPGETDGFNVSDHIKMLNQYIHIDAVVANDKEMNSKIIEKYLVEEQKDPIPLDEDEIKNLNVEIIKDRIYTIEENIIRHDSLKTAYLVFSYLMKNS